MEKSMPKRHRSLAYSESLCYEARPLSWPTSMVGFASPLRAARGGSLLPE